MLCGQKLECTLLSHMEMTSVPWLSGDYHPHKDSEMLLQQQAEDHHWPEKAAEHEKAFREG